MCIDPISLGATALASLFGGGAAAAGAGTVAGATAAAVGAGTAVGTGAAAAAAATGIFGTGISATTALIGGAGIIGAAGAYQQANAEAGVDKQNARNATAAGYANEIQNRDDSRRQMATQLAALSSRGLSLSSGTPLSLLADSARNAELNALNIRANAANTAAGYTYKAAATNASIPYSIAGQLLNGASRLSALGRI